MDATKPIPAKEIVENPTQKIKYNGRYIFVTDTSYMYTFVNMVAALNILAERGWEVVSVTMESGTMFALMQRTRPENEV
jgi:ATP/ADP translocase